MNSKEIVLRDHRYQSVQGFYWCFFYPELGRIIPVGKDKTFEQPAITALDHDFPSVDHGHYFGEKSFFCGDVSFVIYQIDGCWKLLVREKTFSFFESKISCEISENLIFTTFKIFCNDVEIVKFKYMKSYFRKVFADPVSEPEYSQPLYFAKKIIEKINQE